MLLEVKLSADDLRALARQVAEELRRGDAPPVEMATPRLLFTEAEAAKALSIAQVTLKKWRLRGYIRAEMAEKPVRYSREDIEAVREWMKSRSQRPQE